MVLSDAALMLRFLFVDDAAFAPDPDAAGKNLGADAAPVLEAALTSLDALDKWAAPQIEAALKEALVDGLGLKPRKAFAPVRVAVTRADGVAAAVRVDGAARPGALAGPAEGRF